MTKNLCLDSKDPKNVIFAVTLDGYILILIQRSQSSPTTLECASCQASVASKSEDAGSIDLYKWSLCIRNGDDSAWEEPQIQTFVCSRLLYLIKTQAVYKFVAHSRKRFESGGALLVRDACGSRSIL